MASLLHANNLYNRLFRGTTELHKSQRGGSLRVCTEEVRETKYIIRLFAMFVHDDM